MNGALLELNNGLEMPQRVAMKMDRMASWSDESLLRRPS